MTRTFALLVAVPWTVLIIGLYRLGIWFRDRWVAHEEAKRTRERFAREAFYD